MLMPKLFTRDASKKKRGFIGTLLVIAVLGGFLGFLFFYGGYFSVDVRASRFLNPFGEVKQTDLPAIPKIFGYNSVFWKIEKLKLTSFVNVPVAAGKTGRPNPFEPLEDIFGPLATPSTNGSTNDISQGSK